MACRQLMRPSCAMSSSPQQCKPELKEDLDIKTLLALPAVRARKAYALKEKTQKDREDALKDGAQRIIKDVMHTKEPFYMLDMRVLLHLWKTWRKELPSVRPYYAVKCNPDKVLLSTLAAAGSGFDCASKAEIENVMKLGVSADRIVYANPCKAESHLHYAAAVGVNLTTYDSVHEVEKIKKFHPSCQLLLRLKVTKEENEEKMEGINGSSNARCPLGTKYGALPNEVVPLLKAAQQAGLSVSGVSFHIGSGATNSSAYASAVSAARRAFDAATNLGMPPLSILNVGGGFTADSSFSDAAMTLRSAIKTHFTKDYSELSVISEPGRFFGEGAFSLVTNVIGKRVRGDKREYWINDGIYGSMNCLLYDHAVISKVVPIRENGAVSAKTFVSTVFGPTCDALDTVLTGYPLPEMSVGDWLMFPNMGAYTAAAGSSFNGFDTSLIPTFLLH